MEVLNIVGEMLFDNHRLISNSMYKVRMTLNELKTRYKKIHACVNGCILYRKDANATVSNL